MGGAAAGAGGGRGGGGGGGGDRGGSFHVCSRWLRSGAARGGGGVDQPQSRTWAWRAFGCSRLRCCNHPLRLRTRRCPPLPLRLLLLLHDEQLWLCRVRMSAAGECACLLSLSRSSSCPRLPCPVEPVLHRGQRGLARQQQGRPVIAAATAADEDGEGGEKGGRGGERRLRRREGRGGKAGASVGPVRRARARDAGALLDEAHGRQQRQGERVGCVEWSSRRSTHRAAQPRRCPRVNGGARRLEGAVDASSVDRGQCTGGVYSVHCSTVVWWAKRETTQRQHLAQLPPPISQPTAHAGPVPIARLCSLPCCSSLLSREPAGRAAVRRLVLLLKHCTRRMPRAGGVLRVDSAP